MTPTTYRPPSTALVRVRDLAERRLTLAEVRAALEVPVSQSERASILSLVRWFRRRYPTPIERLAYVRRTYHRWVWAAGGPLRGEPDGGSSRSGERRKDPSPGHPSLR
ncbi:MAG: hypothetical protein GEV06_12750 [Luteitalea sp.]|nr:hypothetical protein [Luteitalea sp.]